MSYKTFKDLVADVASNVTEIFPWDMVEELKSGTSPLLLDVRCPTEFERMHISGSLNVPRGILETACEYGYEETVPELVEARNDRIIVICRSGNRSVLAAHTMQLMGYRNVASLKLGLRGWNDDEQTLHDINGNRVEFERADDYFFPKLTPEQMGRAKTGNANQPAGKP
ncbi:MAG: rhodanese-like domain-containing protein [Rhodospirillales bacterium]|nr:rhodanese-like domain-containing protein [Rhodospirillales bacterium]MCW8861453.1 rhodanese-like domain-containing protein [Rhodospirillales bacterium]MCW8969845.1 rhodanese-like domain-containing protein [Rhodospirillales bacterium]MCW9001221.1 rhodanese-like domain-containing protein [Rhodospirillales bacterium]MCW9039695.1 rhodanese-like domain-containing protein [Rhodospirillales bacterium]